MITFHVSAITLAEVLLDMGTATSLREASDLLARLRSHVAQAMQHALHDRGAGAASPG